MEFENQRLLYEESVNNRYEINKKNNLMEMTALNNQIAEAKKRKDAEDKERERQGDLVSATLAQIEQPVELPNKANAATSNEYLSLPRN